MLRPFPFPLLLLAFVGALLLAACRQAPAEFNLEYACLHRSLQPCLAAERFAARIADRTDGRVRITFLTPPLNADPVFDQLEEGTLGLAEIYRGHFDLGGDAAILEIPNLWGLYRDIETQSKAMEAIREDIERTVEERTNAVVLALQFYPSNYVYSTKPLRKAADVQGLKIRSDNILLEELFRGMGAIPNSIEFDSVYERFESGTLDAAVSCSSCGALLKWYEVTDYLLGPIPALGHSWMVISNRRWAELPPDLQEIIREEARRFQETTRTKALSIWDRQGVDENTAAGMEHIEFTPEMKKLMRAEALTTVLPNWVKRSGGPSSFAVEVFNRKVAPIVKVEITEEGKAREIE